MNHPKETIYHHNHEIVLTTWVSKYDGCFLTNYRIDSVGYPYPHRSKEAAIAKAKQIIERRQQEGK